MAMVCEWYLDYPLRSYDFVGDFASNGSDSTLNHALLLNEQSRWLLTNDFMSLNTLNNLENIGSRSAMTIFHST